MEREVCMTTHPIHQEPDIVRENAVRHDLFCFWTGTNPMTPRRKEALSTLELSGLNVILVTQDNLNDWILPDFPLHSGYRHLSAVHKADYLRTYFMHHYGGGYCDIKKVNRSWLPALQQLERSEWFGVGYQEIGWRGVARVGGLHYIRLALNASKLLGNGAYIFKPDTEFTREWYGMLLSKMDYLLPALRLHPAEEPEDYLLKRRNGVVSKYPVRWTQLLGDIFHPLCYKHRFRLGRDLPPPSFAPHD